MKTALFIPLILGTLISQAQPMQCEEYIPEQNSAPRASANPARGILDFNEAKLTVSLQTADVALQSFNNLTLTPDAELSASYFEAYTNFVNEDLSYSVIFEKDWRKSTDPVTAALLTVDDMKNESSHRLILICTMP